MTDRTAAVTVLSPLDRARMSGDVRALGPADRVALLRQLVDEAQLAWGASPPVILVSTEGKLVPYITKSGADQLARAQGVSILELALVELPEAHVVDATCTAADSSGRRNTDVGSCEFDPDVPRSRARARMVASTRARRRTILGLLGSGFGWIEAGEAQAGLDDEPENAL
jgi:hypothetical protein